MTDKKRNTVSTSLLAEILGVTPRRVQQLTKEIPLDQVSRGTYDLPITIQKYIAWIKDSAATSNEGEADFQTEKTLLTRAQRKKAERLLQLMDGDLHKSDDVKFIVGNMVATVRSRLLDIPAKLSPKMIAQKDIDVVRAIIQDEIYVALDTLADYDPEPYKRRSREYVEAVEDGEENEI